MGAEAVLFHFPDAQYERIFVNGRDVPAGTKVWGPDLILRDRATQDIIIVEAKGFSSLPGKLHASQLKNELSDAWLRNDAEDRFLDYYEKNLPADVYKAIFDIVKFGAPKKKILVHASRNPIFGPTKSPGLLGTWFNTVIPDEVVKIVIK